MRSVLNIAFNDLRVFLSDTANLVSLFVLPVVMALLFGFAFGSGSQAVSLYVDVIDLDSSEQSAMFLTEIRAANETLVLCMPGTADDECGLENAESLSIEESQERINAGQVTALLVIPAGYSEAFQNLQPVVIDYYSNATIATGDPVRRTVDVVLQRMNGSIIAAQMGEALLTSLSDEDQVDADFTEAVYANASAQWNAKPASVQYVLTEGGTQGEAASGFNQSVPGMATMFVLFNVLTGMGLLIRERKRWTLQRLVVMPLSRTQLIGGKILARFSMGLTTFILMLIVGFLLGVNYGSDPLALILVVVSYTLAVTALTFAIAPFVKTENQAGSISNLLGIMLAALGGAWWPLEIVPDFMKVVGHFSPVAWAMDGFNELIYYGGGTVEVLPFVGVLLVIAAVLFTFGVLNFEYE